MSVSKLNALATRILRSSPVDAGEQKRILRLLNEVRDTLRWSNDRETVEYLDAATLLISYMATMGSIGGSEVRSVVARLIETAAMNLEGVAVPEQDDVEDAAQAAEDALQSTFLGSIGEGAAPAAAQPLPETPPPVPHLQPVPDAPGSGPNLRLISDMLLGEIMVQQGHIHADHIDQALAIQRQTGLRFGECLIQLGVASWEQVQAGLRYQDGCRQVVENFGDKQAKDPHAPPAPPPPAQPPALQKPPIQTPAAPTKGGPGLRLMSDILLGEILIERGIIRRHDLERALATQRATGMRIGEALVHIGAASWDQINVGLQVQGQMRRYMREGG